MSTRTSYSERISRRFKARISEDNALSRVDGIWYHLGPARQSDAGIGFVRPKRQLNKKELAKHGLSNSAPAQGEEGPK